MRAFCLVAVAVLSLASCASVNPEKGGGNELIPGLSTTPIERGWVEVVRVNNYKDILEVCGGILTFFDSVAPHDAISAMATVVSTPVPLALAAVTYKTPTSDFRESNVGVTLDEFTHATGIQVDAMSKRRYALVCNYDEGTLLITVNTPSQP